MKIRVIGIVSLGVFVLFAVFPSVGFASTVESFGSVRVKDLPTDDIPLERTPKRAPEKSALLLIGLIGDNKKYEKSFTARVMVDPRGQSVNVVSAVISYPKDKVRPVLVAPDSSDFSIFLEEEINEKEGIITITYGKPFPGINKKSVVTDIVFEVIKRGDIRLSFSSDSSVFANDGFGTEVLSETRDFSFFVK